jgi:acid phosphatase type 7
MKCFTLILLFFISILAATAQQILIPPYLQPGDAGSLTKEQKVIIWQTDSVPGSFEAEYVLLPSGKISKASVTRTEVKIANKTSLLYRATLRGLKLDCDYTYRVKLAGKVIGEATFTSRTKKPQTRFVVFGDCGGGTPQQAEIAYQVALQKPQFILVTGDNVYRSGLESEYKLNFFPFYLSREASPQAGAPLMKSVPFYMLLGNHDIYGADLDKTPDGLAYFYFSDLPLNGPNSKFTIKPTGTTDRVTAFQNATKPRYPKMSNFSFDYGNVHIACIDANSYTNPLDPVLVEWLANDMRNSRADWKMVAYHHPGFNSSQAHYNYQQMRLLSPVLEQLNVDMVLTGHVHNYQRTVPLTFEPRKNESGTQYLITEEGRVDGTFTLDEKFDGITQTKPKGIIYIVSGAGGAPLYDPNLSGKPELWTHNPQENWVPFTVKIVSDVHSFTVIETNGKKLQLKQMKANGEVIDEITVTK